MHSFKDVEDKLIMKLENSDLFKTKCAILNLILNRPRIQFYRRINTLKMKSSRNGELHFLFFLLHYY